MCALSNRAGREGEDLSQVSGDPSEGIDGWEDIQPFESGETEKLSTKKIIEIVNKNIPLHIVLGKYNIVFEERYSATGWTHVCKCPFKDHYDKLPSFGYNPNQDVFNCFGCHRSGKTVQFIAYMEELSFREVAETLLDEIAYRDNVESKDISEEVNYAEIEKLLMGYADYVLVFKRKYNFSDVAVKYAEAVTWNLDVYLRKNAMSGTITIDNLRARIEKLKDQIDAFGDSEE
jgi:hypothetical protein